MTIMDMKSILEIDDRLSKDMGVAEKAGPLRSIAIFFAHSGDSWFWGVALFLLWLFGAPFWKQWAIALVGSGKFVIWRYLMALLTRLSATCRRRVGSPQTHTPCSGMDADHDNPLSAASCRPLSETMRKASKPPVSGLSCSSDSLSSSVSPWSPPPFSYESSISRS